MTPVSRTLNAMAYKARYQERNGSWKTKKTTVISHANFKPKDFRNDHTALI